MKWSKGGDLRFNTLLEPNKLLMLSPSNYQSRNFKQFRHEMGWLNFLKKGDVGTIDVTVLTTRPKGIARDIKSDIAAVKKYA